MKTVTINVPTKFQLIKEDTQYEYLIPAYPFCSCKFNELEQKCDELKQCLPEDILEVRVPTMEEVRALPEEIRACSDWWWTSTIFPYGSNRAYCVGTVGYISNGSSVCYLCGFRPIIVRRK